MKASITASVLLALLMTSACGDDSGESENGVTDRDRSVADGSIDAGPDEKPLYAIMYEIYDDESSNSYLALIDSLDVEALTPSQDREFAGGRAFLATHGGAIFVGSPEAPTITRYEVSEDGELTEDGQVSLANYGLTVGVLDAWTVNFISDHKAYIFDGEQGITIIWDPVAMEIIGDIEPTGDMFRDGLTLDTSPGMVRGNRLFRSFSWVNFDEFIYTPEALLGVYDTDSDELLELVPRTRCTSLGNLAHEDEDGNFYFGNWIWPVAGTLLYGAAENCVLRINAGEDDFDADWQLRYADVFDGREGAQFSYTADGKALVAVFNDDETTFDDETDPWDYAGLEAWGVWNLDLETNEVSEVDIPRSSGAFTPVRLDGRQFLMVPGDDWGATDIYEVVGDTAEHKLHIPGWSYQFVKIR